MQTLTNGEVVLTRGESVAKSLFDCLLDKGESCIEAMLDVAMSVPAGALSKDFLLWLGGRHD